MREQPGHDDERPRPVRHRDVGLLAQRERQQLGGAPDRACDLQPLVRAVVPPHRGVAEAVTVGQAAHLEGVARGHDHRVSRALQLPDDRQEERDVGRIVEVDPDCVLVPSDCRKSQPRFVLSAWLLVCGSCPSRFHLCSGDLRCPPCAQMESASATRSQPDAESESRSRTQALMNAAMASTVRCCCSAVSVGNIGSDRISPQTRSVTGKLPAAYPQSR